MCPIADQSRQAARSDLATIYTEHTPSLEIIGPAPSDRELDMAIFLASALQAPDNRFSLAVATILSAVRPIPPDQT
ncbi:hypothetical protein [Aeromicrobium sp. CTD01-1L150]|uniref:hypothetical protein n=1 Tax=Aeromicrobium sp. CTD01-1L150 TaxID=3341830 RepID=UPI0035BFE4C0